MNDLQAYKIKITPKSIKEFKYYSDGVSKGLDYENQICGLPLTNIEHTLIKRDGNFLKRVNYNPEWKPVTWYTYIYNEKGQKIEDYFHNPGDVSMKDVHYYDDNGKLICTEFYIYGSDLAEINLHLVVDSFNSQSESYDLEGNLTGIICCKDDERGNLIEIKRCKPDGEILEHIICEYDENGILIKKSSIVSRVYHKIVTFFDKRHNETETFCYKSETEVEKHYMNEYTFDEHGNWITQTVYLNGKIEKILKREFEYYD